MLQLSRKHESQSSLSTRLFGLTRDQRKLLLLLLGFSVLSAVEFVVGALAADMHAVGYSLHAILHAAALAASFAATDLAQRPKDDRFSYGFERAEMLAAFTNCALVLFECFFTAAHNFIDAIVNWGWVHDAHMHHVAASRATRIATIRAGLHAFGLALFRHEVRTVLRRPNIQRQVALNAHAENMAAVTAKLMASGCFALVAHVSDLVAPVLGSVELTLSLLAGMFLVYVTLPGLICTSQVLLLQLPSEVQPLLSKCLREVSFTEGVLEVLRWSFWPATSKTGGSGGLVGAVCVKVRSNADVDAVVRAVESICARVSCDLTIQVERERPLEELLAGQPSSPSAVL